MPERTRQADAPALATIAPLTGIRGLAASWVVIHHVRDQFLGDFPSDSLYVWTTASSMHPLLTLASFALLVFSLAQETRWFGWLFSNRVSAYLGEISYSVYMVHWLLLSNFALKMQWWWRFKTNIGPLIAAQFLLSTRAVASLLYALVENPARRRLRRSHLTRTLAARAGAG